MWEARVHHEAERWRREKQMEDGGLVRRSALPLCACSASKRYLGSRLSLYLIQEKVSSGDKVPRLTVA